MESRCSGVTVSLSEAGGHSKARVDRTVSREYDEVRGASPASVIRSRSMRSCSCSADCMAAPVRRSRRSRSVRRMSLVSAGEGRRELDEVRVRVAMRMCAKDRDAEAGKNGGRESAIVGEEGIPQKGVEEVGDWHLSRKKNGPDETGKDVEGQRGSSGRAGTVEVDDAEKALDNE